MSAGELMAKYAMQKIAISNELKNKATIERGARASRAEAAYLRYPAWAKVDQDPDIIKKEFLDAFKIKGPNTKDFSTRKDNLRPEIYKREVEISRNPLSDLTRHTHPGHTLEDHLNKVKSNKKLRSVGKKGLIGLGAIGAAYGAKKLHDHFANQPNPSQKNMADKYEAQSMTTPNAAPKLRSAKMNKMAEEKLAISDELRYKALVERGARGLAGPWMQDEAQIPYGNLKYHKPYSELRDESMKVNGKWHGPESIAEEIGRTAPVKGRNVINKKYPDGPFDNFESLTPHQRRILDIKTPGIISDRASQLRETAFSNSPTVPSEHTLTSFLDSKKGPMEISFEGLNKEVKQKKLMDKIKNVPIGAMNDNAMPVRSASPSIHSIPTPTSASANSKTVGKGINKGKAGLMGLGLLGAGYGAKKMYHHFKSKEPLTKEAISPALQQRAFVERSARNLASNPTLQNNYSASGMNVRSGDSRMNTLLPGRANNTVQQAAPVKGPNPLAGDKMSPIMNNMPNATKTIADRATQIRQGALSGGPISKPNQTLSSFIANKPSGVLSNVSNVASKALANPLTKKIGIGAGVLAGKALSGGQQQPQMQKMSFSLAETGLDVLGLGVLGKPVYNTLTNPNATEEEKNHAKWEGAGLGVLAAHPSYEIAHAGHQAMLNSSSPAVKSVGQHIQNAGSAVAHGASNVWQGAKGLLQKVRPMTKLGHTAFYKEMLGTL